MATLVSEVDFWRFSPHVIYYSTNSKETTSSDRSQKIVRKIATCLEGRSRSLITRHHDVLSLSELYVADIRTVCHHLQIVQTVRCRSFVRVRNLMRLMRVTINAALTTLAR